MFPSDEVLLARGKYSTLSHERREQLKRVQGICNTIVTAAHSALRDCEGRPPSNKTHIDTLAVCLKNLGDARERLITLGLGLQELEPDAWGKEQLETT